MNGTKYTVLRRNFIEVEYSYHRIILQPLLIHSSCQFSGYNQHSKGECWHIFRRLNKRILQNAVTCLPIVGLILLTELNRGFGVCWYVGNKDVLYPLRARIQIQPKK